jgi:hypothetical protein
MWTRLVDIMQTRWRESGQPRDRLAKGALTLYGAMTNCREAFVSFKTDQTDDKYKTFVYAIDALIAVLENLNQRFTLFDAHHTAVLRDYALGESRAMHMHAPSELARAQIKVLRAVVSVEYENLNAPTEYLGEFDDALSRLGDFIRANYSLDDLFGPNARSTGDSTVRSAAAVERKNVATSIAH